mmetsp:Transcript_39030/g.116128  ORF Transcript_39030/g.116128 Transcript_39030/m.116128 type:complete len:236 (-) Transcript_39030:490-1197(-)
MPKAERHGRRGAALVLWGSSRGAVSSFPSEGTPSDKRNYSGDGRGTRARRPPCSRGGGVAQHNAPNPALPNSDRRGSSSGSRSGGPCSWRRVAASRHQRRFSTLQIGLPHCFTFTFSFSVAYLFSSLAPWRDAAPRLPLRRRAARSFAHPALVSCSKGPGSGQRPRRRRPRGIREYELLAPAARFGLAATTCQPLPWQVGHEQLPPPSPQTFRDAWARRGPRAACKTLRANCWKE